MEKWQGKIAVVTGASSGIGAAIAKSLAAAGLTVVGLARRSERIEELAKTAKGEIFAYKCDVGDLNSINETFKAIGERFGKVHILINNAGMSSKVTVFEESPEAVERINSTIDVNFTAVVHCTRECMKLMRKAGEDEHGMIINVSSNWDSVIPFPHQTIYPATKYAVRALSEIIRQELIVSGCDKIRVTNLSPGAVKTEIASEELYKKIPHLAADDVAESVVYLLSTPWNVNVTQLTIKPVGERF
jgi:NADP+-dependent farnesol dehydrogenase